MAKIGTPWHDTLRIMTAAGVYSSTKSKRPVIISLFYVLLATYVVCMALIQFVNMDGDIYVLVMNIEALCGYGQLLGKLIISYNKREDFKKLLEKTNHFWKTDVCRDDAKIKLDNMSVIARKIARIFPCFVVVTVIAVIIYSFEKGILLLGVWTFKEHKILFKWTQISQIIMILFGTFGAIVPLDCMFFVTCIQVIIQFKILGHCLRELSLATVISKIDERQYYDKLKSYIQQHNFLLGFLEDFLNYYSFVFMVECMTATPLICTEMYAIWDGNQLDQQIRSITTLATLVFQLSFYCISADSVSSEAMAVGDAMYNSDWYSNFSPTLAKQMIMLIQKSQQPIIFTAGGLFEIKTTTVLNVLRMSWSACVLMRKLKENK